MSRNLATEVVQLTLGLIVSGASEHNFKVSKQGFDPSKDSKKFFIELEEKDTLGGATVVISMDISQTTHILFTEIKSGRAKTTRTYQTDENVAFIDKLYQDVKDVMDQRDA